MNKNILIRSTLIATSLTTVFITALTIVGELYKVVGADGKAINPLKDLLKALHGHHWVGKGVWAVIFFALIIVVFYFLKRKFVNAELSLRLITFTAYTVAACTIILFAFFGYEYLIH